MVLEACHRLHRASRSVGSSRTEATHPTRGKPMIQKQLVVRVDPDLIRRLKILAAHEDLSMAELVRNTLDDEISTRRQSDPDADDALMAAGL